jgi:hypothetical protein
MPRGFSHFRPTDRVELWLQIATNLAAEPLPSSILCSGYLPCLCEPPCIRYPDNVSPSGPEGPHRIRSRLTLFNLCPDC